MDSKTFLILLGSIITIIVLVGIWFIATNISDQSRIQYEAATNRSESYFDRNVLIHENMFDNITDLKRELDPVLDQIDNATELKQRQDRHYNQSFEEQQTLNNVIEMKKIDHTLILQIIDAVNNLTNAVNNNPTIENVSEPIPNPIPGPIIIENRTGLTN